MLRKHGTERAGTSPLDKQKRPAPMPAPAAICRSSPPAEVRQRHRLAELLRPARQRHRHDQDRSLVHGTHRGALPPLRRPSGPRVRRRAEADRAALLHERRGAHDSSRREIVVLRTAGTVEKGTDHADLRARRWLLAPLAVIAGIAAAAAQAAPAEHGPSRRFRRRLFLVHGGGHSRRSPGVIRPVRATPAAPVESRPTSRSRPRRPATTRPCR